MPLTRSFALSIAQIVIHMPCFFPSVSSLKTNLMPVDYVELLDAAKHPLFLVSAYDIAHCPPPDSARMADAMTRSRERGSVILMDSGNYESFWKDDRTWTRTRFHQVIREYDHALCFCYDNQEPPDASEAIAEDVVTSVFRDQHHAIGAVIPIVHGPAELLPAAVRAVAEQLFPVILAVPERALGHGIVERTKTVRRIRRFLNELDQYCPLHLLGTGNPLSIAVYAMAGADSFDGLEWCQTAVDHETGRLYHFHQWDFFKDQTCWGDDSTLPYIPSALMHNLAFYSVFMEELRESLMRDTAEAFLRSCASDEQVSLAMRAIKGDD